MNGVGRGSVRGTWTRVAVLVVLAATAAGVILPLISVVGTNAPDGSAVATTTSLPTSTTITAPDGRPFDVHVPPGHVATAPAPLFILLHGYSNNGPSQVEYMGFTRVADSRGFLFVAPNGTPDAVGNRFWNATAACCDFLQTGVDDEAYLASIIESVGKSHSVDRARIYLVGYSNGGFMSYRMACRRADLIAGIANLAGAMSTDPAECAPSAPVTILHVHGTADDTISYEGGVIPVNPSNPYPGALDSVQQWVSHNRCDPTGTELDDQLDLVADGDLPGRDTTVTAWSGCANGSTVQLWTIDGGGHRPDLSSTFTTRVVDFLLDHPRR